MELASRVRVRVACGAQRDGGELAAISDLGDGGEGESLDHLVSREWGKVG